MRRLVLLHFLTLLVCIFPYAICKNFSSRPGFVNIGAIFTFNSTIGKVAKVAINAAVDDVNSDPSILPGTKLSVKMQDSSCNAFIGIMEALKFMETDILAIIGPQSSVIAHVVSLVSNELQVPLLSFAATDPTLSSLQYPFFVRTTQSDLFQMQAIAEIVDFYQWRKVIAIYADDDYGRNGIASLGDKLAEMRCQIDYKAAFRPGANSAEISNLLIKVNMMESRIIILHAAPDSGLMVFSVAHNLNMMGTGYVWIATEWLASLLDSVVPFNSEIMRTMQGVLALRQHTPDSKAKDALVSRWSKLTKEANDGNFQVNAYGLYAYDSVWAFARAMDAFLNDGGVISFSNDPRLHDEDGGTLNLDAMSIFDQGNILLDKIHKTKMTGVSGQFQFDSNGDLIHPAYDVINVIGTGLWRVGFWSNYTGLSIEAPEELYMKPANRTRASQQLRNVIWPGQTTSRPRGWVFPNNGRELKIGVPNRASFQEFVSVVQSTGTIRGFCIDVFTAAVNLLPYAVPYRFIPYGDGHENPNYSELVNKVASEDFDAAIGDIAITMNRTRIVDFTQPFSESGLVILAAMRKHSPNAWAFLQPFTWEMWCVTGAFFLVVGAVIWILEHRFNDEFRGPPRKQVITVFWFSFSTLFFSHRENTVSTLGRVVLIIWLFVVLIIQSSYTASLTSILTVQQLSSHIKGIESLITSNEPIGFQTGSFAEDYMVELGIKRSRLKSLGSPEAYAKALELGPENGGVAAVVDERPYVELFLSAQCKFAVVGSDFTRSGWGFVFPRDSPLAVDMSTAILTLSESGDLQRIHDKWLTSSGCSLQTDEIDSDRLNLSSFWGLFLICGLACFLSLLIYFILMLRQFMLSVPPTTPDPLGDGSSSKSSRSFQHFLNYIDEKEEDDQSHRSKSSRKSMQKTASNISISNGTDFRS